MDYKKSSNMKFYHLLFFLIVLSCASDTPERQVITGNAFGTTYTIQLYSAQPTALRTGIDSVISAVNRSVSTYMPESDISKINRGDTSVVVDPIFKEVFRISKEVYERSNHYFDPTIGVLRNAYGFGANESLARIDQTVVDSLMQFVGFHKVRIGADGRVSKDHPAIYFDFNAVAKGYGIDLIGQYLDSQGVKHYLIELGGEVLAKGQHLAKDKLWTVGVEGPDSDLNERSASTIIRLDNRAMASSGNYRKFRVDSLTGQRYVHTLNPLTGSAEQSDVSSATVVATSCAEADAIATACMAMGLKGAKKILSTYDDVDAYLTYSDSLGASKVYRTEGFKRLEIY
jgi:FAD:protein FMN transferase